ncbi:hypothetical protein BC629DRAFT_1529856 [Irpex lacteus]|nr:hypothetical protein BC629DRAFT_1529856 [Irpex lacteus]
MSTPIIFYDIPNKFNTAWAPHAWKVRLALNIKGLNYKTEWVEYPDIEALYHRINLPPHSIRADGSGYYCLPVIHDPSTNTTLSESWDIIQYLDKTYPNTPTLLSNELAPLHAVFLTAFPPTAQKPLWNIIIAGVHSNLSPRSQEYFRRTREAETGKKLEDVAGGEEGWVAAEAGFGKVLAWPRVVLGGDKISFPDLHIVGVLIWAKLSLGEESEGWKRISEWHGGRWKRLHDRFLPFLKVD